MFPLGFEQQVISLAGLVLRSPLDFAGKAPAAGSIYRYPARRVYRNPGPISAPKPENFCGLQAVPFGIRQTVSKTAIYEALRPGSAAINFP
jgi:hypothetical protein